MNKTENTFESWDEVISDFFKRKRNAEEEKYLKEELKEVGNKYKKENFFDNHEIELIFNTKKNKKEKNESSLEFQQRRAISILKLDKGEIPETLNCFHELRKYATKMKMLNEKYKPKNWLSKYCNNSSSVSFATHVIKLTHSKIDSPSIYDCIDEIKYEYLSTSALKNKAIDGAVAGNQFAPIFQFLELKLNGVKLAEQLSKDNRLFEKFAQHDENGEELLEEWIRGFRKALDSGSPSSHSHAKQVYFPFKNENQDYHLLCNVVSSSLAHAIYERVFDDGQKKIKKLFDREKFNLDERVIFLQRSHLNVTASNHSNASQLNGKRGGKLHLFSTRPPIWNSQIKPPVNKRSLFSDLYNSTIRVEVDFLRDFLRRFNRLDLSIKDPKRMRHLERWVNNIVDEFLFYIATIQNLPAGWSDTENIKLKEAHRYLLDPYRNDEAFQSARKNIDWQKTIRDDFAIWLNRLLRGKDKQFTPQREHSKLWRKLLEQPLREHMQRIDQEVKQRVEDAV